MSQIRSSVTVAEKALTFAFICATNRTFVTLNNRNNDRRTKFRRSIFFGHIVARLSFSCDLTFPIPFARSVAGGRRGTPMMMRQNVYSPYSHHAIMRRNSLNALLLSLVIHSAVICCDFFGRNDISSCVCRSVTARRYDHVFYGRQSGERPGGANRQRRKEHREKRTSGQTPPSRQKPI